MLMALSSATVYGLIIPLTRFSYDYGVNPETAVLFRLSFGAVAATALVLMLNRNLAIPRQGLLPILMVTISLSAASICYNSAVAFIPVTFTVLIVYTYPLMIVAYMMLVKRTVPGLLKGSSFFIAFAGLALALGPSFQILDWRGVSLALGAAVSIAALFISSATALSHSNLMAVVFYSHVGSVPIVIGNVWLFGVVGLPTAEIGWISHLGAAVCYVLGIFLNFAAIKFSGPARTAMILNLEPIVAMVAAALLLGESLAAPQYLGSALVIGALMLSAWVDLARRPVS